MSANIRKSIGNRPKRRVMSHGHTQVDRNVARASPSPNKVEHEVIRIFHDKGGVIVILYSMNTIF